MERLSTRVESALLRRFDLNLCVGLRDIRVQGRGVRGRMVLFAFFFLVVVIGLPALIGIVSMDNLPDYRLRTLGRTATYLPMLLSFFLGVSAASAIVLEREKQTLELMQATLLTPFDIVTGKAVSVVWMAGRLLLVSVPPIIAVCLFTGLEAILPIVLTYIITLALACSLTSLGLLFSCLASSTINAILLTYVTAGLASIGPWAWLMILAGVNSDGSSAKSIAMAALWLPLVGVLVLQALLAASCPSTSRHSKRLALLRTISAIAIVLWLLSLLSVSTMDMQGLAAMKPRFAIGGLYRVNRFMDDTTLWPAVLCVATHLMLALLFWSAAVLALTRRTQRDQ